LDLEAQELKILEGVSEAGAAFGTENLVEPAVRPVLGRDNSFSRFVESSNQNRQGQSVIDSILQTGQRTAFRESDLPTAYKIGAQVAFDPLNAAPGIGFTSLRNLGIRSASLGRKAAQEAIEQAGRGAFDSAVQRGLSRSAAIEARNSAERAVRQGVGSADGIAAREAQGLSTQIAPRTAEQSAADLAQRAAGERALRPTLRTADGISPFGTADALDEGVDDPVFLSSLNLGQGRLTRSERIKALARGGDEFDRNFPDDVEIFADRLYRETSADEAMSIVGRSNDDAMSSVPTANSPDLALGQGRNRGVLIEFDTSKLVNPRTGKIRGKPEFSKPGSRFIAQESGVAEIGLRNVSRADLGRGIVSLTIDPSVADPRSARLLTRIIQNNPGLEGQFSREILPDGRIRFTQAPPVNTDPARVAGLTVEQLRGQNAKLFNSVDQSINRKAAAADVDIPEAQASQILDLETEKIANRTLEVERITSQISEDLRIANPVSRAERTRLISEGRSDAVRRAAPVLERGEGRQAFNQSQAQLAGQVTPEFDAPIVNGADIDTLLNHIRDLPDTRFLTKINTRKALEKLLAGTSPARNELILLENAFGREMVEAFLSKSKTGRAEAASLITDVFGVPKTIRSAFDLSAPLRQGLLLGPANPREFSSAFRDMFKAINADAAFRMNDEILRDPEIAFLTGRGLFMQSVEGAGPAALNLGREEAFISRIANKIPGVGVSERTFGTFLNKLKHDVGKKALNNWRRQGLLPEGPINRADLTAEQLQRLDSLSRFLNVFTGRGTIPERFQGFADVANVAFWSPRLTISRFEAPILLADPNIRRLVAVNMVSTFATGATILALAEAMIPGVTVEKDPRSSDFGKIRFGSTRLDFWGGFQTTARYLAQIVTNETKAAGQEETGFNKGNIGSSSRTSRGSRILRFGRSKVSPGLATVLANELGGGTFLDSSLEAPPDRGRPPEIIGEGLRNVPVTPGGLESAREQDAILQLTPLFSIELIDAMENYGLIRGTALSLPTLFGVGTTTFNPELTDQELRERSAS